MQTSEQIDKIMPALIAAQAATTAAHKSQTNPQQRYNYAGLEDYMDAIRQPLADNDLAIVFDTVAVDHGETRTTKNGGAMFSLVVTESVTLVHSSGQWVSIKAVGEGMDSGDKAAYKAQTGARKYGIAKLLNVVTSDDPEKHSPAPQAAPTQSAAYPQQQQAPEPDLSIERGLYEQAEELLAKLPGDPKTNLAKATERNGRAGLGDLNVYFKYHGVDESRHNGAMELLEYGIGNLRKMAEQQSQGGGW